MKHEAGQGAEELDEENATHHRGLVALANYISQDRPDIAFAALDMSTTMARPFVNDVHGPKRLARYLFRHPRCVLQYNWQEGPPGIVGYTDSDWGSCQKTRRSVSGGLLLHGSHLLTFWSRKQQTIAFPFHLKPKSMPLTNAAARDCQ